MRRINLLAISLGILVICKPVFAGEFYKLYPGWLELVYHIALAVILAASLIVSLTIFRNFKGGKLGVPWIIILIAFSAMLLRSLMSILTVFNLQYFKAIAFAGLDILFFILLLIGLLLYKVGLE